ncbi:hypothetical protein ACH6EH_10440 [Paenibacillus sp. JSM ZJ436]|uniref:hypothetical protein n=1 Tax=Paenibacillus sp. JSM ZJ436 TaxID=3376190 RepID=UPI0037B096E0
MKEYWGVKQGKGGDVRSKDKMPLKTISDVAEFIDEDERTVKRLLKLNSLIPQLQKLVSAGVLGTTAAEQLAYLTEDEQEALF